MMRDSRKQLLDGALVVTALKDQTTGAVGSSIVMKRARVSPLLIFLSNFYEFRTDGNELLG